MSEQKKTEQRKKYEQFIALVKQAYADVGRNEALFKKGQDMWNKCKNDPEKYKETINDLKARIAKLKNATISFWVNKQKQPSDANNNSTTSSVDEMPGSSGESSQSVVEQLEGPPTKVAVVDEPEEGGSKEETIIYETPAQNKARLDIHQIKTQIASLISLRSSGLASVTLQQIQDKKTELHKRQLHLKRLQRDAKRKQVGRIKFRNALTSACSDNVALASALKTFNRGVTGRPRLETDQPELLSTIVRIVQSTSTADDRRRTECLRTITTLDDLMGELHKLGHRLSRSATYLRLMPRRGNTSEGKRHVSTVPVKLLKPESSLRKKNADRMYAKSFIDDMFEVARLFGPQACTFMSNDDKARVPLGLAAASLQSPILMHLEYKVRLPDHDFVVGPRHKLIPSVYGLCNINTKGEVIYSGDTFIWKNIFSRIL